MGRKGKRVHEQSAGSSAPAFDYETIRLLPTQKQESTGTGSSARRGNGHATDTLSMVELPSFTEQTGQ